MLKYFVQDHRGRRLDDPFFFDIGEAAGASPRPTLQHPPQSLLKIVGPGFPAAHRGGGSREGKEGVGGVPEGFPVANEREQRGFTRGVGPPKCGVSRTDSRVSDTLTRAAHFTCGAHFTRRRRISRPKDISLKKAAEGEAT